MEKYISVLMNKGDCEIVFNIEVEFPLTSDQPGGSKYKHSQAGRRQRAEFACKSDVSVVSPELLPHVAQHAQLQTDCSMYYRH